MRPELQFGDRKESHGWKETDQTNHFIVFFFILVTKGYGVAEQVFVGGFANFLSIFNIVITARVLLSWFPQAQGKSRNLFFIEW